MIDIEKFAVIAANRRLEREQSIPVDEIDIDASSDAEPGGSNERDGAWVRAWIFVSAAQIDEAQEPRNP